MPTPAEQLPQRARLREVVSYFFRLGWIAFGGPAAHIAMMREGLVRRRKWISEQRFLDLLGLANIIPGPSSTELAMLLGYERAGWAGLLLAGILFILPAMLLVLLFAWVYVRFGALPQVGWASYGIMPVIIAIILQALVGLARTAFKARLLVAIGILAFAYYLLTSNAILVIFGGGIVVALLAQGPYLRRAWRGRRSSGGPAVSLAPLGGLGS